MIKNINEILIHETVNEMLDLKDFVTLYIVIFQMSFAFLLLNNRSLSNKWNKSVNYLSQKYTFKKQKITQLEKVCFIKVNELKLTQVELF